MESLEQLLYRMARRLAATRYARPTLNEDLWEAALRGDEPAVRALLDGGVDANGTEYGFTALTAAAHRGHADVVLLLLERGAKLNPFPPTGGDALLCAAWMGHRDLVRLLLERGARLRSNDLTGTSAVTAAAGRGYIDIVRLLLDRGAYRGSAAVAAAAAGGFTDIVRLLLDQGADVGSAKSYWTPLKRAVTAGHVDIVRLLLERGADPNETNDHSGDTVLMQATKNGSTKIVELLRKAGAEEGLADVVTLDDVSAVRTLLDLGANPNARNDQGRTALMRAAERGHTETARVLLAAGADPNILSNGLTALFLALRNRHKAAVLALVEHGANPNIPNFGGETPLHMAVHMDAELTRALLDAGANVNALHKQWGTPLDVAIRHYQKDVERVLIERGGKRRKA